MGELMHTPGPWALIERADERYIVSETETDWDGDRKMVCDLFRGGYSYDDAPHAVHANALLIAASPTLLEALEALLADCGDAGADGYVENSIHFGKLRAARAAIALATGKDR